MANRKLSRLKSEYESLKEIERRSPFIEIINTDGRNPPEKYEIKIICKGITRIDSSENPIYSNEHIVRIFLPPGFPENRPLLTMVTPVWHPNIATSGDVCYGDLGDHGWASGLKISDLVIRVFEMIRYENMGENSAFNSAAAVWAVNHRYLFPLEKGQILFRDEGAIDEEDIDVVIIDDNSDLIDEIIIH